jgi:hypothetical protein
MKKLTHSFKVALFKPFNTRLLNLNEGRKLFNCFLPPFGGGDAFPARLIP